MEGVHNGWLMVTNALALHSTRRRGRCGIAASGSARNGKAAGAVAMDHGIDAAIVVESGDGRFRPDRFATGRACESRDHGAHAT